MTVLYCRNCDPYDKNYIIPIYTYNSLDEYLPDSLIREIMKFQFTEDPKYFNFEIYKQL